MWSLTRSLKVWAVALFLTMKKTILLILMMILIIIKPTSSELYHKDVIIQLNEIPREEVERIFFSDSLTLSTEVFSSVEIIEQTPGSKIDYLTINLSFFPKETLAQSILSLESSPAFTSLGNSIVYRWEDPAGKLDFSVKSQVKTSSMSAEIKEKIPFPIQSIPKELERYTKPSEKADVNPSIIAQANRLAEGEDDLFQVVFNLAQWTKTNIEYNLSTVTSEASQKASWVIDNRQGVCDELTVLFISMARSLGIPARFVSGISYTNSDLFPERWGPHGWAEVWFPGYGWVPFDVTYGEFGYIDASHIVSKIGLDPSEPSVKYEWLGKDVQIRTAQLKTKTEIASYGNPIVPPISIEVEPLFGSVGFGSYNLVQATVQNLQDHYVAADVFLNRVRDVSIFGDVEQPILLKPGEHKSLFWVVKVDEDLDPKFFYEFPAAVYTYENIKAESSFKVSDDDRSYSRSEIDSLLSSLLEEREKVYSKNVLIDCTSPKNQYYTSDVVNINCSVKNIGNVALNDLSLCIGVQCKSLDLGISQQKYVGLSPNFKSSMEFVNVLLKGDEVTKVVKLPISVLERPEVEISEVSHPAEVEYDESFQIKFTVSKASKAAPQNVELVIRQNRIKTEFSVPDLENDREFVLDYTGSDLDFVNRFNVTVTYEDLDKNKYSESKTFEIRLKNLTVWQKVAVYINRIGRLFR